MCIRRFTPSITKEVHLIEVDIGRPLNHFSHKFKYDSLIADAQSVLEHAHTIEKKIETVDGQWYSMKVLPYFSKKNTLDGVVITFNDITDLKNLNEHLQLLSYAIEQSPISIAIFNVTGDIQYVNPQFMKQTGFSFDECVGKHLTELYPADFNEKFADIWDKVRSGETWAGEWKNTRKNGEFYWENVSILPITDEKNQSIYFLKVAEDVTERKKTENLLLESEMHSAVGQLAAGIAHEIRNPLTALKGFTQLMLTGSLNQEYIRIMQADLDRINLIVNELLFLSRPRAVEFEDKNIIAIVREVVGLLESQALMNNCEIVLELEVEKYTVRCVEHQMKQVFINLIKNAIEAMPKGGQITVTAQLLEDFISIQIRDEGCGIPDKMLSKIGQPFFTTKEKGTGLGLMVCQKIIQNHDGKLTIASKENEGTTLHIVLSR
ncbi:ATP-binding protein [Paenibacillus ginsengihumi]|uniref:ATP-binding protein n=1 Tax=Paenibacillus ginsengihumi TaxID=431596 RepID=UPI00036CB0FF|nr:ATP-binding protein [Paenibacillus ginsengihumi]